ncbi:amidohydrolase family protein [Paraburkholderia sp. J12]|uniref:amidohydrolase family protein n=1 Tax=Paraburkholderia sp. J12 TaxID=2805432 RepID=UPI002ABD752F|nr:amidohydrolase family protein [Paraburkholderia sp. J12]
MKIIDLHSHWGTARGYPLRRKETLELQKRNWNSTPSYMTEAEMAEYFVAQNVQTVLDFGFSKFASLSELRELHDYAFEVQRRYPEAILGHWVHTDPSLGEAALDELVRCIELAPRFIGLAVNGSGGAPASDASYEPLYQLCIQRNIPVLIFIGTTNQGSGLPGGGGVLLDHCHPRHLDAVAARFPDLQIVAGRPAWPWQAEANAVLIHKKNVWYELHGWSPKYHTPELKYEITHRLKDRVMFGADYPLLSYERLVGDWHNEGYDNETLERVFHRNAEAFLRSMGREAWI